MSDKNERVFGYESIENISKKCNSCKKILNTKDFKVSAKIPSRSKHYYILCDCGCVMIAKIKNDNITSVTQTPTDFTAETMDMIKEAAELFKKRYDMASLQVALTKDGQRCSLPELLTKQLNTPLESDNEDADDDLVEEIVESKAKETSEHCSTCDGSYKNCPMYKSLFESKKSGQENIIQKGIKRFLKLFGIKT